MNIINNKGITLIEVMMTVAIMASLLVLGSSNSSKWLAINDISKDKAILSEALSVAKSAAMRNEKSIPSVDNTAFIYLLVDDKKICIQHAEHDSKSPQDSCDFSANADKGDTLIWTSNLSSKVKLGHFTDAQVVALNSATNLGKSCIALDRFGFPILTGTDKVLGSTTCSDELYFYMKRFDTLESNEYAEAKSAAETEKDNNNNSCDLSGYSLQHCFLN